MAKRKRVIKRLPAYRKRGWYWQGYRIGIFCPKCGSPAHEKTGIHSRLVCLECGWEEPQLTREQVYAGVNPLAVRMDLVLKNK